MKRTVIIETIAYAFVILFVYTALSKWFRYDIYLYDLNRSPELGPYAGFVSLFIPGSELIVAGLVLFSKTRLLGLYGALALMLAFTGYVVYVLEFTTSRPCTCGGIIRELSWRNHLIFNIGFTLLAVLGIILQRSLKEKDNDSSSKFIMGRA